MENTNDTQVELSVTNHLNKLSLEEVQKIFNQNLDYSEIAHEYVYSTGLNEKGYHSDNDYGDLDKDKEWLVDQLIEGATNDYDGCTTLGELACQLGVDASPKLVDVGEPTKIYFGDNNIIEFNNLDEKLNKIEGLLTEAAIYDPIGFRQWHKEFSSYVEHKFIEEVEKVRNRRK